MQHYDYAQHKTTRDQSLEEEEKILIDYTSNTAMQLDETNQKHHQKSNTEIKVESSCIEGLITQPDGSRKTNKINIESERKSTLAYNEPQTKIEPAPMELSPIAPTIEITSSINNIEIELHNNSRKRNLSEQRKIIDSPEDYLKIVKNILI